MRRSFSAGIGVAAAILIVAACSPDRASREPLAPTVPSLAKGGGGKCDGMLASNIGKDLKVLFVDPALSVLEAEFDVFKHDCENITTEQLLSYLQLVINYSAPTVESPVTGDRAQDLVDHWSSVVLYITGETKTWNAGVMTGDSAVGGVRDGGAKVLYPGGDMKTFDGQAGLEIPDDLISPTGPHLFTFEQVAGANCQGGTSLRIAGRCYDISDYPDGGTYSPPATVTLCLHEKTQGASGIGHAKHGYGTEVLQTVITGFSCSHDPGMGLNSWLGRKAGPLGRAVAHAIDYLRPRPLFADDAGESGSIGDFSLVGGILNDIFGDDFDLGDSASFNAQAFGGTDSPDLGDGTWIYNAPSPGYIRIQDALGNMSEGVLVLSQGQGACTNCPVFKLLGTRKTADGNGPYETIGAYDVTWRSLQNKPSVKEAPFVLFNGTPNNNNTNNTEIARLSYVTTSSQNRLLFKVLTDSGCAPPATTCLRTIDVGGWTQDESQAFKVTLNLTLLDSTASKRVSLFVNDSLRADNIRAVRATGFKHLGYFLSGIDAGIIASDDWFVTRLADIPPQ